MVPRAIKVTPLSDYRLLIVFDNGEQKIYDVKPLIRGNWFQELQDISYFNSVRVAGISVEWEHGHDICPDDLYENSLPFKKDLRALHKSQEKREKYM